MWVQGVLGWCSGVICLFLKLLFVSVSVNAAYVVWRRLGIGGFGGSGY